MALTANQLRPQVDTPIWEWLRFSPVTPVTAQTCSCTPDNSNFNSTSGRYIYILQTVSSFWRYDTVSDTWEQLATPLNTAASAPAASMRFAGAQGYYGRVISGGSNTIVTGVPFGNSAAGFNIRIISGKGAGQERLITSVSDPIVADFGYLSAASQASGVTTLTDAVKNWGSSYTSTGVANVNGWVGYVVRTLIGTGLNQVRKILYNSATVLTTADVNYTSTDPWANCPFVTAPAANTVYQIQSSTITVDTAWDIQPDATSRYVIQSGGIWLLEGAAATPFYSLQYYDVLADVWYTKPCSTLMAAAAATDLSLEKITENASIWDAGVSTGTGTTTTLVDNSNNWATNQWAGYQLYMWSGTGCGQITTITSNTATTYTFSAVSVAPDATTRYRIKGFDGGSASSATFNSLTDSTKTWTTNRWANYAVRIVFGTGAGQLRTIASNTGTALTLYQNWNILPDNTSKYIIQGDSNLLYFTYGGAAETYMHLGGDLDMQLHGRPVATGVACIACAMLSDTNHTIYEQPPIALASLSVGATMTATCATGQNHNFKAGQYVSIRGIASSTNAPDVYNGTGLFQIVTVPSTTTFTYTPVATTSGTLTYLTALSTTALSDASKDYRDNASSGTNTSITFAKPTPSNINGWYVSGTNVTAGAYVTSGGGTTTVNLSTGSATPTGVIWFSQWPQQYSQTATGGTSGTLTSTYSSTPSYITGWYAVGTGIAIGAVVTGGAGTGTLTMSLPNTATVSGTITFSSGAAGYVMQANVGSTQALTQPAVTTGLQTGQGMPVTSNTGSTFNFTTALASAPLAGMTRYVLQKRNLIGAAIDGETMSYYSGIITTGAAGTLTDINAVYTNASFTGTCAQGATTITMATAAPAGCTGWYVTGTGVGVGAIVTGGAGTTSLVVNVPTTAALSATQLTLCAWGPAGATVTSLTGRRVKITSGTLNGTEAAITAAAATTGVITAAVGTSVAGNTYSIISTPVKGVGHEINWIFGNSIAATKGKYLMSARGGAAVGFDKIDITTDKVIIAYTTPFAETLGSGSSYAYDGQDRMYFTKDLTQRVYYLDVNTFWIHGAGMFPYTAGSAQVGNKMEVITTSDGLKYLWTARQLQPEHFRQLIFY